MKQSTTHKTESVIRCPARTVFTLLCLTLFTAAPYTIFADQFGDFTYTTDDSVITITSFSDLESVVEIPSTINGLPVTQIGDGAFFSCDAVSITIPNSVTSIGDVAFCLSPNLTSVTIPDSVTTIGDEAFAGCFNLYSISIPDSVSHLGHHMFTFCSSLTTASIGNSVTSIGDSAFEQCTNLTSITIGTSVTNLGYHAFYSCENLTSVTIPDSVLSIGEDAFLWSTNLTNITIGNSVETIGRMAFFSCPLTSVIIPSSVSNIGERALSCPNLMSVYFQGDAPILGLYPFVVNFDTVTRIYYQPGTSGWGPMFGGLPTGALGIQLDSDFGIKTNGFNFNIESIPNTPVVVETRNDLMDGSWLPLETLNPIDGAYAFNDPDWTNFPTRMYRVRTEE